MGGELAYLIEDEVAVSLKERDHTAGGRVELTNTQAVPEPVSVLLLGLGFGAAAWRRRTA